MSLKLKTINSEVTDKRYIGKSEGMNLYIVLFKTKTDEGWDVKTRRYAFYNENGKPAFKQTFDYANKFKNGLSVVVKNNKVGIINKDGKAVVPFEYEQIAIEDEVERNKSILEKFLMEPESIVYNAVNVYVPENGKICVRSGLEWKEISLENAVNKKEEKSKEL